MSRDKIISMVEWVAIFGIFIVDLALGHWTGIPMSITSNVALSLSIFALLWPLTALITRFKGHPAVSIAETAVKYIAITIVGSALEYYLAMNTAPLMDSDLVDIDGWLGFDWPAFFNWVHAHSIVQTCFMVFYASLHIQVIFLLVFLGIKRPLRARRFITVCFVAVLLTLFFFGLFPATGPFVYFGHTDLPQAFYTEHYLAMRYHTLSSIPLNDLRGIVSFPSLHVAGAVILTYFLRGFRTFFVLAILLNIGMSVASLVIGGHYLADLLSGLGVGLASIGLIHPLIEADEKISSVKSS